MSPPTPPRKRFADWNRRRFLRQGAVLCALAGSLAALSARATPLPAVRTLRFVNTHTGETLTAPYHDGNGYCASCLLEVDHFLRDWRNGEVHPIDPALLDILYELQSLAHDDAPFEVISGYRSPATNAMLHQRSSGVAEHSQHLLGKAIDVRLHGYPTRRLSELARSLGCGGVGYYEASDFVHVDTGPVRFW
jgi:uncharacterized protein YcbK (DUF882 family)